MQPDWEAFGKAIIEQMWPEQTEIDMSDAQDLAVKHGLLKEVPFDPDKHDGAGWGAEPGDPWLVQNY